MELKMKEIIKRNISFSVLQPIYGLPGS
jgi:hypothetical protein